MQMLPVCVFYRIYFFSEKHMEVLGKDRGLKRVYVLSNVNINLSFDCCTFLL